MSRIFDTLIKESLKESLGHILDEPSNDEKSAQAKMVHSLKSFKAPAEKKDKSSDSETITDEEDDQSSKPEKEKEKPKKDISAASAKEVLKQINLIRSGKSSKDAEIKSKFVTYFKSLSQDEQLALQAFVNGLADIFATDESADSADTPFSEPYNLKIKKAEEKTKKLSKVDNSDSAPIVVGESANKSRELKLVKQNR